MSEQAFPAAVSCAVWQAAPRTVYRIVPVPASAFLYVQRVVSGDGRRSAVCITHSDPADVSDNPLRLPADDDVEGLFRQRLLRTGRDMRTQYCRHCLRHTVAHKPCEAEVEPERRRARAPDCQGGPEGLEIGGECVYPEACRGIIPQRHTVAVAAQYGRCRCKRQRGPLRPPDTRFLGAAPLTGITPAGRRGGIEKQDHGQIPKNRDT